MKYLSVCSGIEAATVAWHDLGWTPVAFAEIEAFPAAVLAHHYPTVPNLGDLTRYREWPEELLVEVDLLVGGTPCQAFSVAGLRRSLDDERGNLSLTYVNLFHHINEVRRRHGRRPVIALWENVPGVLSTKDNAFGCFIGGLLGCDEAPQTESGKWDKAGFLGSETVRVGYRVLDAQYFGVAQRRRRVFLVAVPCELVASLGERACPSEILSLRESVLGNPPTRGTAGKVAPTVPARCTAGGGLGTDFDCDGGVIEHVAKPLGAHALSKGRGSDLDNTTYIPYDLFQITAPVNKQSRTADSPCHTLAKDNAQHATVVAFRENTRNEVGYVDPPQALASGGGKPGQGYCGVQLGMQVRRLTPTECAYLQGFPSDYLDITFRKKPAADGPKYRALGNSMAVPCMWWLGMRIHKATSHD